MISGDRGQRYTNSIRLAPMAIAWKRSNIDVPRNQRAKLLAIKKTNEGLLNRRDLRAARCLCAAGRSERINIVSETRTPAVARMARG